MQIKYFNDTDTAIIEFGNGKPTETRELSENLYLDVDESGNPVSLTVEHARTNASMPNVSFQQFEAEAS